MPTARDTFDAMNLTGGLQPDSLADDVVIETPFAADGPHRIEGKAAWLEFTAKERANLPFRLDSQRVTALHETTDPNVLVVEYELTGTALSTGRTSTAPFIGVLRVRDGLIVGWREYQDTAAITRALT